MYQNLRPMLPESKEDTRSVHFLPFPEVKSQYFDSDIERAVARMQNVIELGRVIRDKKNLPLKTPLRELLVINPDDQYHADISSLESYIVEELNIRSLKVTKEEEKYGIKYKIIPDHKILGQLLKKEYPKIRKVLSGMLHSFLLNVFARY